jgi:hypothetical protein
MTDMISPRRMDTVTFSTARTPPNIFDTASTASIG